MFLFIISKGSLELVNLGFNQALFKEELTNE